MMQHGTIASIGYETQEFTAFDDVGVKYSNSIPDGRGGCFEEAHISVKFSVASAKSLTAEGLADPATINASKICILERLRDAVEKSEKEGRNCLFYLRSPWPIVSSDLLGKIHSRVNGALLLDVLFEGKTAQSKSGKIRKRWADVLKIEMDDREAFDGIFNRFRIQHEAKNFDEIRDSLSTQLTFAGLKPIDVSKNSDQYCTLIQRLSRTGSMWFDAESLRAACKQDDLWVGTPPALMPATTVGIRSFFRFSESLEDEVDELLCLTRHFEGRHIRNDDLWEQAVLPELQNFLSLNLKQGQSYRLHCPAVGSIAFASGYLVEPKLGASLEIYQPSQQGRALWSSTVGNGSPVSWHSESVDANEDETDLVVAVSITQNIKQDVEAFLGKSIPTAKTLLHLNLKSTGHSALGDGQQSFAAADELSKIIAEKKLQLGCTGRIHLFWAAPNAFVFMLGQCSRPLGELQLHEFDFEGVGAGRYKKSTSLCPTFRLSQTLKDP